ncbi:MAG: MFS transporter [Opitutaceae bacterium]|jgi:predicted MFS family arabinose efflux permease|nr:MFS transporter [Opitutaceae bacterium]
MSDKLQSRAWLVVGLLWVVGCLNYLDRIMLTTMRESIVGAIPMSDAQFGLLTSVFLWVYAVLSPLGGFLADKFSRSRLIIISLLVWSIVTWLTGHAQSYGQLLAMRALMGVSEACYIPAALALIADYHRGPTRSFATGIHMTGVMAGQALGGLGGVIAERHEWGTAFTWFGVFGIAYAAVLFFLMRDPADTPGAGAAGSPRAAEKTRFREAMKSLFSRRAFLLALGFWGLLGLANWAVLAWMPTHLGTRFNLGQGVAGMSATGYLQVAAFGGVLFGGWWADRWSRTNRRARILVTLIGMLVSVPAVLLVSVTHVFGLAVAGLVVFGGVRCFADANMMPIMCMVADRRYRATGYGVLNLFSCAIGGVSIWLGGIMRDARVDLGVVFMCAAGALAVCAVLLALVKPPPEEAP